MRLRFTQRATDNLAAIADYVLAKNPSAALRIRDDLHDMMEGLRLFPAVGRPQKADGVRKVVTRRYGYLIYYIIGEASDEVIVLSVRHPAQDREYSDR